MTNQYRYGWQTMETLYSNSNTIKQKAWNLELKTLFEKSFINTYTLLEVFYYCFWFYGSSSGSHTISILYISICFLKSVNIKVFDSPCIHYILYYWDFGLILSTFLKFKRSNSLVTNLSYVMCKIFLWKYTLK